MSYNRNVSYKKQSIRSNNGGENEKRIGIVKEIDSMGRLVIPKEMRTLFFMDKEVELVVTDEGVLIRNPEYRLVPKEMMVKEKKNE